MEMELKKENEIAVLDKKELLQMITKEMIEKLETDYGHLKTNGVEDKDSYKEVKEARLTVKNLRLDFEKARKALIDKANKFKKDTNSEADKIISKLEPLENRLLEQQKKVDDEIDRIKKAEEEREQARIKERTDLCYDYGMIFNGSDYIINGFR